MDAKTREALEASIAHWEGNASASAPEDATTSAKACALCHAFFLNGAMRRCDGCPVFEFTGKHGCDDTPYQDASNALVHWIIGRKTGREAFGAAAQAELAFLKSLRPTDDPTNGGDNA